MSHQITGETADLMSGDTDIDWEQCYREGTTPWEKGAPHPELEVVLGGAVASFGVPDAAGDADDGERRVLVPGCGFGHDVRAIASRFPAVRVTGLDIAPSALAAARARTEDVANAEILEQDVFNPPDEWQGSFDVVFEHTCLSAIHPSRRVAYASVLHRLLRPGGRIVAVFFINPDMDPGVQGPPFGIERPELDELFGDGFELLEKRFPIATYPGREQREEWRVYRAL